MFFLRSRLACRYILFFLLCGFPAAAAAASLTLPQAVAMAMQKNRQLLADSYRVESANLAVQSAQGHLYPRLDMSYTAMRTDSPLNVFGARLLQRRITPADFNIANLNNPSAINNYQPRLTLSLPLYQGGELWAGREGARQHSLAAEFQHQWLSQQIVFQTVQLVAQLRNAEAQVAATEKALQAAEDHLSTARAMARRGVLIKADVMDAEVHRLNVEVRLNQLRNMQAQAEDRLRTHLNLAAGEPLHLVGAMQLRMQGVDMNNVERLAEDAVQNRADLLTLQAESSAAEADVHKARSGFLPHVSVQASQEWNNSNLAVKNGNATVAAVVSMNVFAGGSDHAEMGRARANSARLSLLLDDRRQQVRNEVHDAWRQLRESMERRHAMAHAFQQARESLRIVKLRFEKGLEKATDLLDAQSRSDQAEAASIQANFDAVVAQARVLLAAGKLEQERVE